MDAKQHQELFFHLLRQSMGLTELTQGQQETLTDEDWQWLYEEAERQSLTGVICGAVTQLPASLRPPLNLMIKWMGNVEMIKGMNELLYEESARLTKLFGAAGHGTAILKGQANARLYPDKYVRVPGDIDIYVDGGRERVLALLQTEAFASLTGGKKLKLEYHHVHLPTNEKGVSVEVHFRSSSGTYNPFTNRRLQRWLNTEIMHTEVVEEGFRVPTVRFALMMQLAHVQRHFMDEGIGLRQICDYYMLLKHSTKEDRWLVAAYLKGCGLQETAGALMWVLGEVLQLDRTLMLCEPDSYRGEWMLRTIMEGGNFGHHAQQKHRGKRQRVTAAKRRHLQLLRFNFWEAFWMEEDCWKFYIKTLPARISRLHRGR